MPSWWSSGAPNGDCSFDEQVARWDKNATERRNWRAVRTATNATYDNGLSFATFPQVVGGGMKLLDLPVPPTAICATES